MPASRRFTKVAAALAAALFVVSWGLLHVGWYDDYQIIDLPLYEAYGNAIESGDVPYRDFRPEYPPGALLAFAVPSVASVHSGGYRWTFEALMVLCGLAMVLAVALAARGLRASRARLGGALALVAGFPLLLGSVVFTRFDLYPAALVAGAVAALVHRRDRLGFGLLGAAIAVKLYPAVLVPLAAAYVWRRRGRREALVCVGIAAGIVTLVFLPFLLVAPDGVAYSFGHQLSRPLQIESLGAAFYFAVHHLLGLDVEVGSGHGSQNLYAKGTGVAAVLLSVVQLATLVWIWMRRPGSPEELVRWSAAALVAFVVLGKVLSPQFLIWLVPVVPLVAGLQGLRASVLLAGSLVLTQLWFPSRYWDLVDELDPLPSGFVVARDLVLVALLVVLLRGPTDSRRAPARSP